MPKNNSTSGQQSFTQRKLKLWNLFVLGWVINRPAKCLYRPLSQSFQCRVSPQRASKSLLLLLWRKKVWVWVKIQGLFDQEKTRLPRYRPCQGRFLWGETKFDPCPFLAEHPLKSAFFLGAAVLGRVWLDQSFDPLTEVEYLSTCPRWWDVVADPEDLKSTGHPTRMAMKSEPQRFLRELLVISKLRFLLATLVLATKSSSWAREYEIDGCLNHLTNQFLENGGLTKNNWETKLDLLMGSGGCSISNLVYPSIFGESWGCRDQEVYDGLIFPWC